MRGYTIFVEAGDKDFRVDCPDAKDTDAFCKWLHESTGAGIQSFDLKTYHVRKTYGDFQGRKI